MFIWGTFEIHCIGFWCSWLKNVGFPIKSYVRFFHLVCFFSWVHRSSSEFAGVRRSSSETCFLLIFFLFSCVFSRFSPISFFLQPNHSKHPEVLPFSYLEQHLPIFVVNPLVSLWNMMNDVIFEKIYNLSLKQTICIVNAAKFLVPSIFPNNLNISTKFSF